MKITGMVLVGNVRTEPYYKYCIQSIRELCDEIIIVTPINSGLAEDKSETDYKKFKVLYQDFQDSMDFAKWRNHVLDEAKGEWVLWLDSDEILANSDGSSVKRSEIEKLCNWDADNIVFPTLHFMYNYFTLDASGQNDHVHKCMRLFKNDGRRFKRKVHEYIDMDPNKTRITNEPIIWHFGHCKGMEDLAKRYRERHIQDNPFTGHMSQKRFKEFLKTHHKLRGRIPTVRYDGPLPKIMNLW